jgi:NifB/MoaA-like Fe-S oxidoreductase
VEYQPDLKNISGAGGTIAEVARGSIAQALGLLPGDVVCAVGGRRLRDVIDYRFATAEARIELLVQRGDEETIYEIEKDPDEDLGIEFVEPLFDRLRTCNNKCPFCFLTQMPKGMRRSLYLKDDDYRLGFLYGNFVTLTNLAEEDWRRIEEQHLSPMYVSIHATDPALRAVLLGKPDVPDVLAQIQRFGQLGIAVHTQIVALPGLNDGAALHQSIRDLAGLYPTVQTIAVVPVGLTRYRFEGKRPQSIRAAIQIHETPEWIDQNWERQPLWDERPTTNDQRQGDKETRRQGDSKGETQHSTLNTQNFSSILHPPSSKQALVVEHELGHCARQIVAADVPMRCYRPDEAARIVDALEPYQERFRQELGVGLVYPSDEFYLLCGRELPPAAAYDGMPQYSNGIGMTRDFLDEWAVARRRLPARMPRPTRLTLVCGTLIAPVLQQVADRLNRVGDLRVELLPVVNQFFGATVTVSGLLMGQDVVAALNALGADPGDEASHAQRAVLPRVMFDHTGKRTLDEYSPERIAAESGVSIAVAGTPDELLRHIRALARSSEF